MEWASVIASVVLGFVAAQLGAMLQFRRDQKNQRTRDEIESARQEKQLIAENERLQRQFDAENLRLRQQLDAQAEEASATRGHSDLIDWRSRRIQVYGSVSTAAAAVRQAAMRLANSVAPFILNPAPTHAEIKRLEKDLRSILDEAELISDEPLRETGRALWQASNRVVSAAQMYVRRTKAVERAKEDLDKGVTRPTDEVTAFWFPSVEDATDALEKALEEWRAAIPHLERMQADWVTAARGRLGVPD